MNNIYTHISSWKYIPPIFKFNDRLRLFKNFFEYRPSDLKWWPVPVPVWVQTLFKIFQELGTWIISHQIYKCNKWSFRILQTRIISIQDHIVRLCHVLNATDIQDNPNLFKYCSSDLQALFLEGFKIVAVNNRTVAGHNVGRTHNERDGPGVV